jgi:hypothetical protein
MRSDGWIAALTALVIFIALATFLAIAATEWSPPASGSPTPAEDGTELAGPPMLCVTPAVVCTAPALPAGYPCTCLHPLRGTEAGWVAPVEGPGIAILRDRAPEPPPFDWDELVAP